MADKFDLNIMKVGLENANFGEKFAIRDALNAMIQAVQLDLDDIGFEPSEHLKVAIENLENELSDSETPVRNDEPRGVVSDDVTDIRELLPEDDEEIDDNVTVVNVDDELDEFGAD